MEQLKKTIRLGSGTQMPMLGLGVYNAQGSEAQRAVEFALNCGYRLIDTASVYKNEDDVGRAIRSSSVPREELFITTKVWNTAQRLGDIEGALLRSLERLGLSYIDLYLIHFPVPGCYLETWRALEQLYRSGKVRAIGVSNFEIHHLETLAQISDITPAVNQIEVHPLCANTELVSYCQEHKIAVQAYSPLARGAYQNKEVLQQIGSQHGKSAAQTGLRWLLQRGIAVIPKSVQPQHIEENAALWDFELSEPEMQAISALNEDYRLNDLSEHIL